MSVETPFTTEHIMKHLEMEARLIVDRGIVTKGQRLAVSDLLLQARDEIDRCHTELHRIRNPRIDPNIYAERRPTDLDDLCHGFGA